jgi:hypothetical protein
MSVKKFPVEMITRGRYSRWDERSRELPRFVEATSRIPAEAGVEFGYVVRICKARGERLQFEIHHPPFNGCDGKTAPPFIGTERVRSNDLEFFLGDCIWEPVADKIGTWRLILSIRDTVIADESFDIVPA